MEITDIIKKIKANQLFIPAFQREYVWKRPDAKNLIRSLLKKYPTGTMLTWETNTPPELKGDHVYHENQGSVKLILDGQQRITTLYMLITGEIPPYYGEEDIKHNIFDLYVNLESLELEYFKKILMQNNPAWVSLTEVFRGAINPRDVTDEIAIKEGDERLSREREGSIYDNIRSIEKIKEREFVEQEIPSSATLKEAIDIFYIVNASGVNLTDAELALAQISGYWPQARELFKAKLSELEKRGWVFKLDFIVYLLLGITHKQGSKMEKLHIESENPLIREVWESLDSHILDYTCSLLQSHAYVDHSSEINSIYALVPLVAYIYKQPDRKLKEREIQTAIRWFYYSQIRQRYISQLPAKLDKDIRIIATSDSPFEELLANIASERDLDIRPSDFEGRDIRHPLFSMMRWFFKSQGAVCLGTGLQLHKNMGKSYALERDHIFAYSVLRDSDYYHMDNRYDYAAAQEITNRAILTSVENRTKSAMMADTYLSEVKVSQPKALALQCIPEDENLWELENFKDFLKARRQMLADGINSYLDNLSNNQKEFTPSVDIEEIIEAGESCQLEFKSTLRWNVRESRKDKKMEEIILKSIAAFSNGEGGTLLIGVADDGEVLGLQEDYDTLKEANKDHFELHLRNLVNHEYGTSYATTNLSINFPIINEMTICQVQIRKGAEALYTQASDKNGVKKKIFFVRSGNSSQGLEIDQAGKYIQERFPKA